MKKRLIVLSLFMVGLMVIGVPGMSRADDETKVSGFVDVQLPLSDEAQDNSGCTDGSGKNANCTELQTLVVGEVDFERTQGDVTVRADLDFPAIAGNTFSDHIEQLRFDWTPGSGPMGLTLTGGVFNTPIGLEGQDATDILTVSNGLLFSLLPVNHAGLMVSGGQGPVSASLLFVNDWNGTATTLKEENSIGATASFMPMPIVGLTVGWISSEGASDDVVDIIVAGGMMPSSNLDLGYAIEYVMDDTNDALGITLHVVHGPHAVVIRYDTVDTDAGPKPTAITLAASVDVASNLKTKLEWRTDDPDTAASSTDKIVLQFVATF